MDLSEAEILRCCASRAFAAGLAASSPFADFDATLLAARRIWWKNCGVRDWLEAFDAHPRIGDVDALEGRTGASPQSSKEQGTAMASASEAQLQELVEWNKKYAEKFGHVFLIFASSKTAADVLAAIKERYGRSSGEELLAAAGEQMKITEDRLRAMLGAGRATDAPEQVAQPPGRQPPITTHVLDTCRGCPAEGVPIALQRAVDPSHMLFEEVAAGTTGGSGRASLATPPRLPPGKYRLKFGTGAYLDKCWHEFPAFYKKVAFFPEANVDFEITEDMCSEHFHIPLLLSPYGYSTYRGS